VRPNDAFYDISLGICPEMRDASANRLLGFRKKLARDDFNLPDLVRQSMRLPAILGALKMFLAGQIIYNALHVAQ
jgi:hypothetical protein